VAMFKHFVPTQVFISLYR